MYVIEKVLLWTLFCVHSSSQYEVDFSNHTTNHQDNYLTCGTKEENVFEFDEEENTEGHRRKRSATVQEKYLELVLVVDYKLYQRMGRDKERIYKYCQDVTNVVNAAFTQFDLLIVLVDVVIWTSRNLITVTSDTDTTLNNFKTYAFSTLKKGVHHDVAHLLIGSGFIKASGVGSVGGISTSSAAGVVASSSNPWRDGMIMSHELGHNFGLNHNKIGCCEGKCIMDEIMDASFSESWSYCSRKKLRNSFADMVMSSYLHNFPQEIFGSGSCGNGIIEAGEECDCGLKEACKVAHCCHPENCTLVEGATCSNGKCCDQQTCQLRPETTLCRSAKGDCDLEEYCDGTSAKCPEDLHKQDGLPCSKGQVYVTHGVCSNSHCVSHDLECQKVWKGRSSSQRCYRKNVEGTFYGNCGAATDGSGYIPCANRDVLCGQLKCNVKGGCREKSLSTVPRVQLTLGSHGTHNEICCVLEPSSKRHSVNRLGLVPEGAQCGENKFCVNKQCIFRDDHLRCAAKCNGNGICNNKGNCHCVAGRQPPDCSRPGHGGSVDSGPINVYSYQAQSVLYILFLVAVPIITGLGSMVYLVAGKVSNNNKKKRRVF